MGEGLREVFRIREIKVLGKGREGRGCYFLFGRGIFYFRILDFFVVGGSR